MAERNYCFDPDPFNYSKADIMLWSRFCGIACGVLCTLASLAMPAAAQDKGVATDKLAIPASDEGLPGAGPIRRADWFQNTWRTRRTEFAANAADKQGAVVSFGDSITQGWGDRLN